MTAKDGYELSLTNTADGVWSNTLTGSIEGADSAVAFYVRNKATGAISEPSIYRYKLDKNSRDTHTTGKVYFTEKDSWDTFLQTITFELFYNKEVTMKVDAADKLSGVKSISYVEAQKALSLEQVKALADSDWTAVPADGVAVTLEDAKQFVCFVRIIDMAGNVTYLSTNGAEYDTTPPIISNLENGEIYWTTQEIAVYDKNFETVTLNNKTAGVTITLEGNKDIGYTIVATDKAGNSTSVTVKMKPIASLFAPINNIVPDHVQSHDKATIQAIKAAAEAIGGTGITDAEKTLLEEMLGKCDEMLEQIAKIEIENENSTSPGTGDSRNLFVWIALFLISGSGVLTLTAKGRRKKGLD